MRGPEAVAAAPALARGGAVRSEAAEAGAVQVELLEGRHARVVPLGGGPARTVPRASLPAGVREGDVVVDGRRDAGRTAELWREVAALRRRLAGRAGEIDLWRADAR